MTTESLPESAPPSETQGALPELRAGMRLGRYQLLVPIARGGMADVWVAQQSGELGFRRLVAVKTILAEHAQKSSFRRMFLEEARVASRIHHANVVEVLDLGEEGALVYQAMTLVEGDSVAGLQARMRTRGGKCALPVALAARLMADVAAGLHAAHELTDEEGVPLRLVHRDVSPQNILVGLDGSAKIADFGVAKALGRVTDETEAGQLRGKLSYLSPEQVARRPLDRRSDVFAAGIVTWELVTGARLFRGEDVIDTLARVASMPIADVRDLAPGVPARVAEVIAHALERDPDARFATAAAFADALERAASEASALASAKDVGAFVRDLAGADIERRREGARAAARGGAAPEAAAASAGGESVATLGATHTSPTSRGRRATWTWMAAGAVGLAAAVSGSVVLGSLRSRAVGAPGPDVPRAAPSAETPPAGPASSASASSPTVPAPSPPPSAPPFASASTTTRRPPAKHAPSAAPIPRFANPY